MLDQEVQVAPDWLQQLAAVVFLAGCAAMTMPRPKPKIDVLPAVEEDKPAEPEEEINPSPEAQEFMHLPPQIRRQVLDYAKNWIDANFERTN